MRESRTYGSVRGALSDERPYRDRRHDLNTDERLSCAVPTNNINASCTAFGGRGAR
jgi:hypothetical protein